MKELAMFYNFSDERFRKAKFALMPLKIQVKKVEKEDFNQPIGFLAGIKGIEPAAEKFDGDGFDEEMIVMHNFTNKTIDSLIKSAEQVRCRTSSAQGGYYSHKQRLGQSDAYQST